MADTERPTRRENPNFVPRALNIDDAEHYCGIGRTQLYKHIKEGRLIFRRIGGRTIFLREDLDDFIDRVAVVGMPDSARGASLVAQRDAPARPEGA